MALTAAERAANYRERQKQGAPPVRYRRPADRRTRPQRWRDAVQMLADLLDEYEAWRDRLPPSLANGATAERLEALVEYATSSSNLRRRSYP